MHDIGGIVWIIVVVIAVISSIRRNAMRARNAQRAREAPAPTPAPVRAPIPVPPPAAPSRLAMSGFAMPPIDAPIPVVTAAARAPRPVAPTPPPFTPFMPARVGTSPIRGMFEGGATLVRAIVAAEVLGPPKAMQENTIWSPRHSEPSI